MDWLLPLGICLARIADVSLGTLRIGMIAREKQWAATLLAFFEVLIWLAAIGTVMANLDAWWNVIAYAVGYAAGNYVGLAIQRWMAMGQVGVRIITGQDATGLIMNLRSLGYGVTMVPAHGSRGPVSLCFVIVQRRDLPKVIEVVHAFNPQAFYTLEDVRFVSAGVTPIADKSDLLERLLRQRKTLPSEPSAQMSEADIPSPATGNITPGAIIPRS